MPWTTLQILTGLLFSDSRHVSTPNPNEMTKLVTLLCAQRRRLRANSANVQSKWSSLQLYKKSTHKTMELTAGTAPGQFNNTVED